MNRILPYPWLALSLLVMWLLLQQAFSPGHILFGGLVGVTASLAMAALEPQRPKVRRVWKLMTLITLVTLDILRSNIAVILIVLRGKPREATEGFLFVPLELKNTFGLMILACIVTATPGSAWIEYNAMRNTVLIHVLDLVDEGKWIKTLKDRYETLLLEIFE